MKILVLGGTGAMGTPLVSLLANDAGNEVIVTSRSKRESRKNVTYKLGNAKELTFLQDLLKEKYDAIIDFMVYGTEEFKERVNLFLDNTSQYFFFSSSRCYAECSGKITEDSKRLIDVCQDQEYLSTDEYALAKGREENILKDSGKTNWTIIRPYITYNDYRLQLGVYEKEQWLWRALNGRTIIMPKDIAEHKTTLTYGIEVASSIISLINDKKAFGQVFHITSNNSYTWGEILNLYQKIIYQKTGETIKVKYVDNSDALCSIWNKWQIRYDRLFDREFDNSKIQAAVGPIDFTDCMDGLTKCLNDFLDNPKWLYIDYRFEAWADRISKERTPLHQIKGLKHKAKYFLYRYFRK